jgi:acyl-CoA synthetase (AMP-forming)/AMP-acid ligase II
MSGPVAPDTGVLRGKEILSALRRNSEETPDDTAVVSTLGGRTTWSELYACALEISTLLDNIDGDGPVMLVGDNSPGYVAGFYGALLAGRVVVPAQTVTPSRELRRMAETVGSSAEIRVVPIGRSGDGAATCHSTVHLTAGAEIDGVTVDHDVPQRVATDLPPRAVLVGFTSGSTGEPKAVVHAEESLLLGARTYCRDVLASHSAPVSATLPLSHAGAISVTLLACLLARSTLVVFGSFTPVGFATAVRLVRGQVVMLVPPMVNLLKRNEFESLLPGEVAAVVLSGAPVDVETSRVARELTQAPVRVGMGMSECPGCFLLTPTDWPIERFDSVLGATSDGFETRVLYDHELAAERGADRIGELQVRASQPALGYLHAGGELLLIGDGDGWIATGDLVTELEDGCYALKGRRKEMYIHGGYNVYPAEVEAAIRAFPGVDEVVVHGVPDPLMGESGFAWIAAPAGSIDVEELRGHLAAELARYKMPQTLVVVDALPRNRVGKLDKPALARQAAERSSEAAL